MKYDPIKRNLGSVFNKTVSSRVLFYKLLDLLLLRTWHIKKELRQISGKLPQPVTVLDAGAGFGQYSFYMSDKHHDWDITAVDVKEEQVEDCNRFFSKIGRQNRVNFIVGDLTKFREKEKYSLILCVDVMEHILEDDLVFANYFSSLKPNGALLISTPSDQGGSDVHDEHDESFIDEHVRDGYNIQDIQEKLEKAGFSKVQARYSYGTPGKVSWKLSMKYPITLLNKSKLFFVFIPFYYLITFPFSLILNKIDVNKKHNSGTGLIVKAIK